MSTTTQYETRRRELRASPSLNGIDYLEVDPSQTVLRVYFLNTLNLKDAGGAPTLTRDNMLIEGGDRVRDIRVKSVAPGGQENMIEVTTERPGDFSLYQLRLIKERGSDLPPDGFDRILSAVGFSFKAECPNEFDCAQPELQTRRTYETPPLDYLTRDYAGFRRLILDRLKSRLPGWNENNPADLAAVIAEILAYAADYHAYYQDAVAAEAYLGTARRRVSVRRHARLLDYALHEGCNARVYVAFRLPADFGELVLPEKTALLTRLPGFDSAVSPERYSEALNAGAHVFETMHDALLTEARNELPLYSWGEPRAVLPAGSCEATLEALRGDPVLRKGDVLLLEQTRHPESGLPREADPELRHAARLISDASLQTDPLYNKTILRVRWHEEDALPFDLPIGRSDGGDIAVARANVALADYGRTLREEDGKTYSLEKLPPPDANTRKKYRPRLALKDLTYRIPYNYAEARNHSAAHSLKQDPRSALPEIILRDENDAWTPARDLLHSEGFATEFVLETEEDGRAYIRFGDNVLGKRPAVGSILRARYRVGNGSRGNLGAEALAHVVTEAQGLQVRNPLSARGGQAKEPLEQARLYAPSSFKEQKRAVTEEDYARLAEKHPGTQKAQARLRWMGSRHVVFISVDRTGGLKADEIFRRELSDFLEPYRLAGHEIAVQDPLYVPLEIVLKVQIASGYLRTQVKKEILTVLSAGEESGRSSGFFHPDRFTFGQTVYLSEITAVVMKIQGLELMTVLKFGRMGESDDSALRAGRIPVDPLEIVRLDNNPNAPENGRLEILAEGGL